MPLSGRDALIEHLERTLATPGVPRALVLVRLRKLAAVAKVAGEGAVRALLEAAAGRLRVARGVDGFVAELGEGTFAVVIEAPESRWQDAADRLLVLVAAPVAGDAGDRYAPANAGVCAVSPDLGDAPAHVERALQALEQAMAQGPGAVEVLSESSVADAAEEWRLRELLEEAAVRGEFSLAYQPIHAADGGDVRKVEALLRWTSPVLGQVGPGRFIPVLEQTGMIVPVGEWVLRAACTQACDWRRRTGHPVRLAVNVSPIQLLAEDFEERAARALEECGCEAAWMELEVTESALIRDFTRMRARLASLEAMGFTLAIDDFGAGYSSLGQLAQLPVHHLKMDRSLIAGVPDGGRRTTVVNAVMALAAALGLSVTSEGVERCDQAQWLSQFPGIRCQGYLFSRPMQPSEIPAFLR